MPLDNVAATRDLYAVFDTDLEALLGLLDPDIEWVSPPDAIEPGIRRGLDGVRSAYADTAAAWDDATHSPEEFEGFADDKVLVTVTFRGHGRGSGMDAERAEFHLWTLRAAVPVRFEWFYQREQALEAAGLGG